MHKSSGNFETFIKMRMPNLLINYRRRKNMVAFRNITPQGTKSCKQMFSRKQENYHFVTVLSNLCTLGQKKSADFNKYIFVFYFFSKNMFRLQILCVDRFWAVIVKLKCYREMLKCFAKSAKNVYGTSNFDIRKQKLSIPKC